MKIVNKILLLLIVLTSIFQQCKNADYDVDDENDINISDNKANDDDSIDDGFDEFEEDDKSSIKKEVEKEQKSKINKKSESVNIESVDISELEVDVIPTDKIENPSMKKLNSIIMLLIDTKQTHLSTQLTMNNSKKVDIFSPNWFKIEQDRSNKEYLQLKIDGHNNYNKDLVANIKFENAKSLIIPSLSCEHNFRFLSEQTGFFNSKSIEKFVEMAAKKSRYYKIDGFFLDCLDLQINLEFEEIFIDLIIKLGSSLHKVDKKLILNILPYSEKTIHFMSRSNIESLNNYVDYFVINTIEYNKYAKRPVNFYNSPIFWVKQSLDYYITDNGYVEKSDEIKDDIKNQHSLEHSKSNSDINKFIIKIPFFGVLYELQHGEKAKINQINSSTFMNTCMKGKTSGDLSFKYDDYGKEHLIHITKNKQDHYLSFPTRKFFKDRIELINNLGIGGACLDEVTRGFEDFVDNF